MRILFLILVIAAVAGAWWATRQMAGERDLAAVVVFDQAGGLREGDPITLDGREVGRIIRVEPDARGGERVHVLIRGEQRADVRVDSVWEVRREPGTAVLEIDNRMAVGRPVEDGATLRGGVNPTQQWLARAREWSGRIASEAERIAGSRDFSAVERQFDEWTSRLPEWKSQGGAMVEQAREQIRQRMLEVEARLRAAGRHDDADRVRERLERWLAETRDEAAQGARAAGEAPRR